MQARREQQNGCTFFNTIFSGKFLSKLLSRNKQKLKSKITELMLHLDLTALKHYFNTENIINTASTPMPARHLLYERSFQDGLRQSSTN